MSYLRRLQHQPLPLARQRRHRLSRRQPSSKAACGRGRHSSSIPASSRLKPEEVVIGMQTELKRVGCDPGAINGAWGGRSRDALAAFGHFAKVDVGKLAPTPEVLDLIKGETDVVCSEPAQLEHHAAPSVHHKYCGYGGGCGGAGYGGGGGSY